MKGRPWRKLMSPRLRPSVVAILAGLVASLVIVKWGPALLAHGGGSSKVRAEEVRSARTVLLTLLGGTIAVFGAVTGHRSYLLTREGHITDGYTRAVEQLGSPSLDTRLGGIFALERISRQSSQDLDAIVEILAAYVRTHAPVAETRATDPGVRAAVERAAGSVAGLSEHISKRLTRSVRQHPWTKWRITRAVLIVAARTEVGSRMIVDVLVRQDKRIAGHPVSRPGYWRRRTSRAPTEPKLVAADVQAALDILGRQARHARSDRTLDLSFTNLNGITLKAAWLPHVDLSGSTLRRAQLNFANLRGARLVRADLTDADMYRACLEEAVLVGANLQGVDLRNSDMRKAHLTGVELRGANLKRACLDGAELDAADAPDANFRFASLNGACCDFGVFSGSSFRESEARGASFADSQLQGIDAIGADLDGAVMIRSDIDDANLSHANLRSARLGGSSLRRARLGEANLAGSSFRGACLDGADLQQVEMPGADFTLASMQKVKYELGVSVGVNDGHT